MVLCQPAWMWGAEMGANDRGVVVGNEAVYGRTSPSAEKSLLRMDYVRHRKCVMVVSAGQTGSFLC